MVVAGPGATVFLLGRPELALPSEWAEASARIADGTFPSGWVVDIASAVVLLVWVAAVWLVVTGVRRWGLRRQRDESPADETAGGAGIGVTDDASEPEDPWYRQGSPIFEEPFTDDYPRVVVPADDAGTDDDTLPDDGPADSLWQPDAMTEYDEAGAMPPPPEAPAEDTVSDGEIIGQPRGQDPDEPPMIVPVRAYYFTRTEDTLRSISAQFLQTPTRWEQLRSLNASSPGVAAMGPDSLLPVGTALALPGDPLPWGKPDPVYLWTLAEKFLYTAWGREPMPEEVVPFWRGLTSGAQLEAGAPPVPIEHLTAPMPAAPPEPVPTETFEPQPQAVEEPAPESEPQAVQEPAPEPQPQAVEEPAPEAEPQAVEEPALEAEPQAVEEPALEAEPQAVEEPAPEAEPQAVEEPAPESEPQAVEEPAPEPRASGRCRTRPATPSRSPRQPQPVHGTGTRAPTRTHTCSTGLARRLLRAPATPARDGTLDRSG